MTKITSKSALAALLLALVPGPMLADQLIMKNGDVITGDISSIDDSKVTIKPAYADEFAVNLAVPRGEPRQFGFLQLRPLAPLREGDGHEVGAELHLGTPHRDVEGH